MEIVGLLIVLSIIILPFILPFFIDRAASLEELAKRKEREDELRLTKQLFAARQQFIAMEAKSLVFNLESAIEKILAARQQRKDILVSIREGIPNIFVARGLELCEHITALTLSGTPESEAIRKVVSEFHYKDPPA